MPLPDGMQAMETDNGATPQAQGALDLPANADGEVKKEEETGTNQQAEDMEGKKKKQEKIQKTFERTPISPSHSPFSLSISR